MTDVRQPTIERSRAGKIKSSSPARARSKPAARRHALDAETLLRQLDAKIAVMADAREKIRGPRKEQH